MFALSTKLILNKQKSDQFLIHTLILHESGATFSYLGHSMLLISSQYTGLSVVRVKFKVKFRQYVSKGFDEP